MKKQIGKIVNTHGIKGELRVLSNSDFKDTRFAIGNKLEVKMRSGSEVIEIEDYYQHKTFDIIKLKGFDNINDVLKFKNSMLLGESLDESVLEEGEYFVEQILGLKVIDQNQKIIGIVKEINTQNYQKLLVIENEGKKALIPYVDEFIKEINLESKTMEVNLIPGLVDEN